jgi:hypothetical protein
MTEEVLTFDGDTFDPERDGVRLTKQHRDVWRYMQDERWHTLSAVSHGTGHPEASVSARLRDLRKRRFGGHTVERRYVTHGIWAYRLVSNPDVSVSCDR